MRKNTLQHVLSRVSPEPNSGCFLWMAHVSEDGYGTVRFHGRMYKAHRLIYELTRGPIPEGLDLDHLCKVKCCVNPQHLEPVTRGENGRRTTGLPHNNTKSRQTHCLKGHEFIPANTRLTKRGTRQCRTCDRLRNLKSYYKLRGQIQTGDR